MPDETEHKIGLHLSDAEIIDMLGSRAAGEAVEVANQRANSLIAMALAAFGLLAGAALVFIDQRIEARLEAKVAEVVDREIEASIVLPLLAAEINSIANGDRYTSEDAETVLDILHDLAPDIRDMSDTGYWLSTQRIEEAIDLFWNAGDYARVFQVDRIFEHDLMHHDGIYFTFAESMASGIVIHPDFSTEHQASFDKILDRGMDHRTNLYERQRLVRVLSRASEAEWTKAALMAEFQTELSREPFFHTVLVNWAQGLRNELSEGGRNHTDISAARYSVLISAIEDY